MLIKDQLVEVKWNSKIKKHYLERGYKFTKMGDSFLVKVEDLTRASKSMINLICDYCKKEYSTNYNNYIVTKENEIIKKDSCKKCSGLKLKESNQKQYGVNSTAQIKEIKEKQEQTNLKRYGFKNVALNKEVKDKINKTNLEKYGFKNPLQNEVIRRKAIDTNQERYGVNYPFQNEDVQSKVKDTHVIIYGFENPMSHPDIKQKAISTNIEKYGVENVFELEEFQIKAKETIFKHGNAPCSKQQKYICKLLNGTLNLPMNTYFLDIAFTDDKIYLEYDGGGHDLSIKHGNITEEEYKQKEIIRNNIMKRKGWKKISIVSRKDLLPSDDIIIEMFKNSLDIFNQGRSWVIYDIDSRTIEYRNYKENYDFGKLRLIKYKTIEGC